MKKKLGPLPTWQWLAIGVAVGVVYYIYKARKASAGASSITPAAAATGATDLGPIDPTTGQPYAIEGAYGPNASVAQNAGPTSLAQELSDLANIESLFAGLPVQPSAGAAGTPVTVNLQIAEQGKRAVRKAAHTVRRTAQPRKQQSPSGEHNPGHTITHHPNGQKTISSSVPHNTRQHQNVQPPNHQRANPTRHYTAGRPPKRPRHHG